jgi:hypothetical protein
MSEIEKEIIKKSIKEFTDGKIDNDFIEKVKRRNRNRFKIKMYQRIWLYSLMLSDWCKNKMKQYN